MLPSDAEMQYLDNARKLPLYGVDLHQASVSKPGITPLAFFCPNWEMKIERYIIDFIVMLTALSLIFFTHYHTQTPDQAN